MGTPGVIWHRKVPPSGLWLCGLRTPPPFTQRHRATCCTLHSPVQRSVRLGGGPCLHAVATAYPGWRSGSSQGTRYARGLSRARVPWLYKWCMMRANLVGFSLLFSPQRLAAGTLRSHGTSVFLVSNFGSEPDFPRRCLSVVLRLHGQGSAYVPFTSRGRDCQVVYLPTGCPRHCATLFHQVASVVFVSTDKRTSTSCYRHSGLSSESLTFSLFAGFLPVPHIGVSSTPSAFAGESESLQQQAHAQLLNTRLLACTKSGCDEWPVQQFKVLGVDWRSMLVLSASFSRPENRRLVIESAWVYWEILRPCGL